MNRLFWSLIIFEAVIVFGLAILNLIPTGEGGSNVFDRIGDLAVAAALILLAAVAFAYCPSATLVTLVTMACVVRMSPLKHLTHHVSRCRNYFRQCQLVGYPYKAQIL